MKFSIIFTYYSGEIQANLSRGISCMESYSTREGNSNKVEPRISGGHTLNQLLIISRAV